jgi:hypothetical protein
MGTALFSETQANLSDLTVCCHSWRDTRSYTNFREFLKLIFSKRHKRFYNWSLFLFVISYLNILSNIWNTVQNVVFFSFSAFEDLITAWNARSNSETATCISPYVSSSWRRYLMYDITGTLIPLHKVPLMYPELRLKRNSRIHVFFHM